jgi:ribonucleotide monophosphatase NagD (HAD superfamily)
MVPDQNFGVIIVTNRSGSSLPKVAEMICEMFLDLEAAPKNSAASHALTAAEIARYAGTYANGDQRITLRGESDALVDSFARYTKAGKDYVAIENDTAHLVGVPGSGGKVEYIFTGGRSFRRMP